MQHFILFYASESVDVRAFNLKCNQWDFYSLWVIKLTDSAAPEHLFRDIDNLFFHNQLEAVIIAVSGCHGSKTSTVPRDCQANNERLCQGLARNA